MFLKKHPFERNKGQFDPIKFLQDVCSKKILSYTMDAREALKAMFAALDDEENQISGEEDEMSESSDNGGQSNPYLF